MSALDILQSDKKAYCGILLPTLTTYLIELSGFMEKNEHLICQPLASVLIDGIKTRFYNFFSNINLILGSAFHPNFKLCWLHLLALAINKAKEVPRSRVFSKMTSVFQNNLKKEDMNFNRWT